MSTLISCIIGLTAGNFAFQLFLSDPSYSKALGDSVMQTVSILIYYFMSKGERK